MFINFSSRFGWSIQWFVQSFTISMSIKKTNRKNPMFLNLHHRIGIHTSQGMRIWIWPVWVIQLINSMLIINSNMTKKMNIWFGEIEKWVDDANVFHSIVSSSMIKLVVQIRTLLFMFIGNERSIYFSIQPTNIKSFDLRKNFLFS